MYTSDKDKLLYKKLDDAVDLCYLRQKPYYFAFMSERSQALAEKYLQYIGFENYLFFGGCQTSERKMLGLFFDNPFPDGFPLQAIEFKYRKCDILSHRDFLGTLMSLGIEREIIGDILVEDGRCVIFIKKELCEYIINQISKIGRVGVSVGIYEGNNLPKGRGQEKLNVVVSSLRLDNIVAAICNLSREKTKALILSDSVSVNFLPCQNISRVLDVGSTLSIRGKGKYEFSAVCGQTAKGRIRISVIHYR